MQMMVGVDISCRDIRYIPFDSGTYLTKFMLRVQTPAILGVTTVLSVQIANVNDLEATCATSTLVHDEC